jgi:hypothetical protein
MTERKLGIPKETPDRRSDVTSQTTADALLATIERHGGYSAIEPAPYRYYRTKKPRN